MTAMIVTDHHQIALPEQYSRILSLHAAFNNTFVFLALKSQRCNVAVHMDSKGTKLYQQRFKSAVISMGLVRPKDAVFLQPHYDQIHMLNLQTYEDRIIPHTYLNKQIDRANLYIFPLTSMACLEEKGNAIDKRYRLTYYKYPFKQDKAVAVFDSVYENWTVQYTSRQGNMESMVLWYKAKHGDTLEFNVYQVQNATGWLWKFNIAMPSQGIGKGDKSYNLAFNAWEIRRNTFIFLCWNVRALNKTTRLFIVDIQNNTVREPLFSLGPYQDNLIHCLPLDNQFSMLRTFPLQDSDQPLSPVFYFNNQTEQIVAEEYWHCSNVHNYQSMVPNATLCESIHSPYAIRSLSVTLKRIFSRKELYLSFLLGIEPSLNNHLLEDALSLLM